jgi:hypothetical protein
MVSKPKLKYEVVTNKVVDYSDWDKFINECYGISHYEVVPFEQLNNYSCKNITAGPKKELDKYDKVELNDLLEGKNVEWITNIVVQDLVNKDLLEPGDYLLNIFW